MDWKPTPPLFYGSAGAAAIGLALGLLLHSPWQTFEGAAPRILFTPAEAAESRPTPPANAAPAQADANPAVAWAGYETPHPLPVTVLAPRRTDDDDALQAAQDDGRADAGGLMDDDDGPPTRDIPLPRPAPYDAAD